MRQRECSRNDSKTEGGRRWHQVAGGEGSSLRSGCEGQERRGVMPPGKGRALQERSRGAREDEQEEAQTRAVGFSSHNLYSGTIFPRGSSGCQHLKSHR